MWKYIKAVLILAALSVSLPEVYSSDFHREITPILQDWGFPASEQEVIIAVFRDADSKGLDLSVLLTDLRENRVKEQSYYEAVVSLLKVSDNLYKLKTLNFPFQTDRKTMTALRYLVQHYTFKDLQTLSEQLKNRQDKMNSRNVQSLLNLGVMMHSQGVSGADGFSILYLMLSREQYSEAYISLVQKMFYIRNDLKISPANLGNRIKREMLRGSDIKQIFQKLEKEAKS